MELWEIVNNGRCSTSKIKNDKGKLTDKPKDIEVLIRKNSPRTQKLSTFFIVV